MGWTPPFCNGIEGPDWRSHNQSRDGTPISPRRADAHHGQEASPSSNRSDIRAQSHLGAGCVIRTCFPCVAELIPIAVAKTTGPIHHFAECDALFTAAPGASALKK